MRDQRWWTWHVAAGVAVLLLLGLHMTVMHLDGLLRVFNPDPGEPTAWANVFARARSAAFLAGYVLLLGAALFHGFYGLRTIVFELNPGATARKAVSGALVTAGVLLFVFGTWAAWTTFQAARVPVA
jgi:succinate dehydrogenase hydrophobic anchor subunit